MPRRSIIIARMLRARETTPEEKLWEQLRSRRLDGLKFRRQVPIDRFFADFACLEIGLTIELDGRHHDEQTGADDARRQIIETHGFIEVRFTNLEINERLDWVVQEIRRMVDVARNRPMRAPHPRWDV
jgi:very-short-patch-repair endonuclease